MKVLEFSEFIKKFLNILEFLLFSLGYFLSTDFVESILFLPYKAVWDSWQSPMNRFYWCLKHSFHPVSPWTSCYMDLKILEKPFNFTLSNLYELWYKTGPIFCSILVIQGTKMQMSTVMTMEWFIFSFVKLSSAFCCWNMCFLPLHWMYSAPY